MVLTVFALILYGNAFDFFPRLNNFFVLQRSNIDVKIKGPL